MVVKVLIKVHKLLVVIMADKAMVFKVIIVIVKINSLLLIIKDLNEK